MNRNYKNNVTPTREALKQNTFGVVFVKKNQRT